MSEISIEPISRQVFNTQKMMEDFPPRFLNPNKKIVYGIACPPGSWYSGRMVFSRWAAVPLPSLFSLGGYATEVERREDMYGYEPTPEDSNTVEWYLNFSDADLFCAYGGALLAQDEMQVAEHPSLGSLREALLHSQITAKTVENNEPTPILIMGVERRCSIATDPNAELGRPQGLYGNNFAWAKPEVIRRATKAILPPTITNIIAMAAISGGRGTYSLSDIEYILRTAYTGFSAARIESGQARPQRPSVVVHTGFWGCGAFGGNRILMALLQILAGHLSQVDRLVIHTHRRVGSEALSAALQILEHELAPRGKACDIKRLLVKIQARGFQWGVSNGT